MKPFASLLLLECRSLLVGFNLGGSKKKRAPSLVGLIFVVGISLALGGLYGWGFVAMMAQAGYPQLALCLIGAMAGLFALLFTAMSAAGTLFSTKDLDILLALPITPRALFTSKVLALYLENFIITSCFLLPAAAAAAVYFPLSWSFWPILIVVLVAVPFFPCFMALLLSYLIAWFKSHFNPGRLFSAVLAVVGFVLLLAVLLPLQFGLQNVLTQNPAVAFSALSGGFPPLGWMANALFSTDLLALLWLCISAAVPFALEILLLARSYTHIVASLLTAHTSGKKKKLSALKAGSLYGALFKKELNRFLGTPIYLLNSGLGLILAFLAPIALLIFRRDALEMLSQLPVPGGFLPIMAAVVLCALSGTCYTAAVSISLEKNALWQLLVLPIETRTILSVKTLFPLLLQAPLFLYFSVTVSLLLGFSILDCILILLTACCFTLLTGCLDLTINLLFPRLDAASDTAIVKQSLSALLGMLLNVALAVLIAVPLFTLSVSSPLLYLLVISGACLVLAGVLWAALCRWGAARFRALT
ncbi:MAG: hypothetical protein Q4G07_03855 [Oscillospiraceae bacterium]|nr:hypothetical protein [Oscillospiraceae bacterium]